MVADPIEAASARCSADPVEESFPASAALTLNDHSPQPRLARRGKTVSAFGSRVAGVAALERWVSPFTYGRWMPLHTDWHLYGWCSLPIAGLFVRWLPPPDHRHANVARGCVALWSLALLAAGMSWIDGYASGKLFLTSTGIFRFGLPTALVLLWACLAAHLWHARHSLRPRVCGPWSLALGSCRCSRLTRVGGQHSRLSFRHPDSGGATGASLLGSTLVVSLSSACCRGIENKASSRTTTEGLVRGLPAFFHGVFGVIDHGHVSHHQIAAIVGLATLLGWVPLLGDTCKASPGTHLSVAWRAAQLVGLTGGHGFRDVSSEFLKR